MSSDISQFQQIISMATRSISTIFKVCDQSLTNTAMLTCFLCSYLLCDGLSTESFGFNLDCLLNLH